jgi:L-ascorbate metabolism protein UlaG (beta-lactamase superfamily)
MSSGVDIRTLPLVPTPPEPAEDEVLIRWLGQAGFLIRRRGLGIVIDPYLSDSLADKYRGGEFAHLRMMPPPMAPEELHDLDWVLCTHAHTDHMDPGTLPALADDNPRCYFVVPRAEVQTAAERDIPRERLVPVNAGERLPLDKGMALEVLPSAHEELQPDAAGQHRFLGYILRLGSLSLYHSGDCVPYDGLAESLAAAGVDVALLPVNGRDAFRRSRNILGNFTFREAVALCVAADIPVMFAHHVGMFDYNTVADTELAAQMATVPANLRVVLPRADVVQVVRPRQPM